MKKDVLITIIIPCYNSFHLMMKGLIALEQQGNEDVEVIVVDDCSTDNSYDQLLGFATKSNLNIQILRNKINSGPGCARNNGIMQASGKYITFLDADDYFSDHFIKSVIPFLRDNLDCLIFDYYVIKEKKSIRGTMFYKNGVEAGAIDVREALVYTKGATCGKIYRTDIIQKYDVKFLPLKRNEDMPFTKCAIAHCKKIQYLDQPFYNYVQHEESLMHNRMLLDPSNAQKAFFYIKDKIGDVYPDEVEALFALEYMYSTALTNVQSLGRKEFFIYIKESHKIYSDYFHNKYLGGFPSYVRIVLKLINLHSWVGLKVISILKNRIK